MLKNILKLARVKQWIKNIIVFVPLIFSGNFSNLKLDLLSCIAFFVFCLTSSAIYIFNDIVDVEKDRQNPIKKHRPLASGLVSINQAKLLSGLFLFVCLLVSYNINILSFFSILGYIFINIAYTLYLKKQVIIDVICIALGFILRILLGCFVIKVYPSPQVILLTLFLSMFFTFSKRKLELKLCDESSNASLLKYSDELLNQLINISITLSIAFYFIYMMDNKFVVNSYLYITTIPFTIILFQILYLINVNKEKYDITEFIYNDKTLKIYFVIYLFTLFSIIVKN